MKNYEEAVMLLKELSSDAESIKPMVGFGMYGALIIYSFRSLDVHFFDVITLEHLKSNYEYSFNVDFHDNYYRFTLPDFSVLNISDHYNIAWVQIPIKNT